MVALRHKSLLRRIYEMSLSTFETDEIASLNKTLCAFVIRRMKKRKLLIAFLIGLLVPILVLVFLSVMGGRLSDFKVITIFFPYGAWTGSKNFVGADGFKYLGSLLFWIQFPLYGVILATVRIPRQLLIRAAVLLAAHILAVIFCLQYYG
jgi:hypothetical protein